MNNRLIVIIGLVVAVGIAGFAAGATAQLKEDNVKTTGNIQVRNVESDTLNIAPVSNGMMTPVQVKATCNDDEIVISGGYVAILPDNAKIVYAYTDFEDNSYKITVQNYNLKKNGTAIVNALCLKALDGVNVGNQGSRGQAIKENEKEAPTNLPPSSQSGASGIPADVQKDVARTENMQDALLIIDSNTDWSGAVQGSDFVMESIDGSGYKTRELICEKGGIYSIVMQKMAEGGKLTIYIAENGKMSKQASTTADYGVASLAGTCK